MIKSPSIHIDSASGDNLFAVRVSWFDEHSKAHRDLDVMDDEARKLIDDLELEQDDDGRQEFLRQYIRTVTRG